IEVFSARRCQLGESPLWSPAEEALWWVDIEGRALHRLDPVARRVDTWHAAERIGCIALHPEGGFIAALEDGIWHLRPQAGGRLEAQVLARVQHPHEAMRFNDGRCDRDGRFWAVTMARDTSLGLAAGSLYR